MDFGTNWSFWETKRSNLSAKEKNFTVVKNQSPAQKKTSTCAVSALLRTRIDQGVPQGRFLDPTTIGGLASDGRTIGSQRVLHRFVKRIAGSRTLQRFVRPSPAAQRECTMLVKPMQGTRKARFRGKRSVPARSLPVIPQGRFARWIWLRHGAPKKKTNPIASLPEMNSECPDQITSIREEVM